jgi:hypothetical protein
MPRSPRRSWRRIGAGRFDAVLAHNAEAALAALARRALDAPPDRVRRAHRAPRASSPPMRRAGRDRSPHSARVSTASSRAAWTPVVALSHAGASALGAAARGPVVRIPPALAPSSPPTPDAVAAAWRAPRPRARPATRSTRATSTAIRSFATLAEAAAKTSVPIVVATHAGGPRRRRSVTIRRDDAAEVAPPHARRRGHAARAARAGGFPIKLLNYMEAARADVAYASIADPLVARRVGRLLADDATTAEWAHAVDASPPIRRSRRDSAPRRARSRRARPATIAARFSRCSASGCDGARATRARRALRPSPRPRLGCDAEREIW